MIIFLFVSYAQQNVGNLLAELGNLIDTFITDGVS